MDWDKLRIFHAVADAGSLTHAGEVLHLSQSAVSRQIRALEESLNTTLFHRHARGLILTEQGELLFDATQAMVKRLDAAAARACPLQPAELEALRPDCLVYDILYIPRPTTLLQQAAAHGCAHLDGLAMLVGQGAAALRLWSGIEALPLELMQTAALAQLAGPR